MGPVLVVFEGEEAVQETCVLRPRYYSQRGGRRLPAAASPIGLEKVIVKGPVDQDGQKALRDPRK